ncbi:MAG: VWA domain-containing protein [Holophagales bacterium]|nr:VWA domain-containing protein [Holophagales bacterium]
MTTTAAPSPPPKLPGAPIPREGTQAGPGADLAPARAAAAVLARCLGALLLLGAVTVPGTAPARGQDAVASPASAPVADAGTGETPPLEGFDSWAEQRAWIEVLDARGRAPESLGVGDLQVEIRGQPSEIVSLGRPLRLARQRARLVLYFDPSLSGRGALGRAAGSLAEVAGELTALGDVEVVTAPPGERIQVQLRSREPLIVGERLRRMALTERSEGRIEGIRANTLAEVRRMATASPPATLGEKVSEVLAGIGDEQELVRGQLDRMAAWVTAPEAEPTAGPRMLLWALEGYDLDPVAFYVDRLDESTARQVLQEVARLPDLGTETRRTARMLAAAGWTVMPVSMPVSREEEKAAEYSVLETPDQDQKTLLPGVTIRPGQIFRRDSEDEEEIEPTSALQDPTAPLERLAEASGGEVVISAAALRDALDRLGDRRQLVYRTDLAFDSGTVPRAIRTGLPGGSVRASRWTSRGLPPGLAELRLRQILRGDEGEMPLVAVLEVPDAETDGPIPATLEARLDLHDLEASGADGETEGRESGLADTEVRITVESLSSSGAARLTQQIRPRQDLGSEREWSWRGGVTLPADSRAVVVLVEEMSTGLWAGRRATVVRAGSEQAGVFLPSPAVLEIERPEMAVLRGRVSFEVSVFDARIERLAFLLDERQVAERGSAPWSARLDLGRTPRRQTLTVVGFDSSGTEVGRESVVLNGGDSGLAVRIVAPTSSKGVGPIEVEAEVSVPVERNLDRLLFFWNNEQVATLFSPPYRQPVVVPSERPVGYIRVVALLDDGSLAEDVLFMNGPDAGERLEVNLVELYVVVTNRDGRPVRGLRRNDFVVEEEGVVQQIATFDDAADLPLTLGMTLDSSASMFVKLPRIQRAATDFLRSTFSDHDRAFVVDFDSTPRLVRGTTGDLDRLEQSIYSLEASGRTALWEAIVYSLVQLQGVRGRKALVVFSDGADEDDQFPFRTSMRIAREMSVPIYLILMRKEPENTPALGLLSRSFTSRAQRLTQATGGRVFYAKEYGDLGDVYAEIEQELRSQYLLTYYPEGTSGEAGWRNVKVDVTERGLTPRTLTGYWQ